MAASTVRESNAAGPGPGAGGAPPPQAVGAIPAIGPGRADGPTLAALARTDQRRRWARGERVLAEVYLDAWPALKDDPPSVLDVLHGEYVLRAEHGDAPSLDEYRVRFPPLAAQLEARLQLHVTLLGGGRPDGDPATLTDCPGSPAGPPPPTGALARPATRSAVTPAAPVDMAAMLAVLAGTAIPSTVAGYQILGVLGRGGMGVVYKARQPGVERVVALKMILAGAQASPTDLARFRLEAEAVGRLQHPNVVHIYEVGQHEGRPFLTLEFCGGGTLADRLDGTPLPPRRAAELVRDLARGTEAAHRAGIVHRDLKPSNVLLADDDTPKITDFGLAKRLGGDPSQTRHGAVLGTPSYMAPEQASGQSGKIGPAADVYALGSVLYELLVGRPPFKGATAGDTVMQVLIEDPVPPRRLQPQAPRDLETIALKCLEKDPPKRYASAADLAEDLQRFLDGVPIKARPVGPLERLWKWARRRPALAGMTALSAVLAALGFGLVSWKWWEATALRRQADQARGAAEENERRAVVASAESEGRLYFNRIALADREWLAHNVGRCRTVLDTCPPELRRWEWGYLRRLCEGGLFTLRAPGQQKAGLSCLAASPDRKHLASGGGAGVLHLWDLTSGTLVRKLGPTGRHVLGVAFSPNGKLLASASATWDEGQSRYIDGEVKLWHADTGAVQAAWKGHASGFLSVAFSPDGAQLASGDEDGKVLFWDLAKGTLSRALAGHTNRVSRVAYNPAGGQLASAGADNQLIVWDPGTGREIFRREGHRDGVTGVAFSPDGKTLVTAAGDRTATLWGTKEGRRLRVLHASGAPLHGAAFSPDGKKVVTAGDDRTARVWDAQTGQELLALCGHGGAVRAVTFTADGERVASAGDDGAVKVWDSAAQPTAFPVRGGRGAVKEVAFAPDGRTVAEARGDGVVRLREVARGEVLATFAADLELTGVAFSPRGDALACPATDRSIRVWDVAGRRELRRLDGHAGQVTALAFSGSPGRPGAGALLASASQTIRVWDPSTGRPVRSLAGHKDVVDCLAFSPDGKRLASGSKDGAVLVWDVDAGSVLASAPPGGKAIHHLAFSPDGKSLAVAGPQGTVELRDAALSGTPRSLPGHTEAVWRVAFTPDGTRLASAGADRTIKLWDTGSAREVLELRGHSGVIHCLTFSPDGKVLASGGADQTLRLWSPVPTRQPAEKNQDNED